MDPIRVFPSRVTINLLSCQQHQPMQLYVQSSSTCILHGVTAMGVDLLYTYRKLTILRRWALHKQPLQDLASQLCRLTSLVVTQALESARPGMPAMPMLITLQTYSMSNPKVSQMLNRVLKPTCNLAVKTLDPMALCQMQ